MVALNSRRRLMQAVMASSASTVFGVPISALANAARGGSVVIGTTQTPPHLNSAVQSGLATMSAAAQLFVTPLRMNDQWQPQPYLAESWVISNDSRHVTLRLHPDAHFHDGRPITSADLAFSIEAVKRHHPFRAMLAPVDSIVIVDDHTAILSLKQAHPALIPAMTAAFMPIMPRHVFGDGTDLRSHPRNTDPVGSGPFRLAEFEPGSHIRMVRNDDFFQTPPLLDELVFKVYKSPAQLMRGLRKGEIDIHPQLANAPEVLQAQKFANVIVQSDAAPAVGPLVWLSFNMANPKLTDKRVRQAINYAIDKDFIVKVVLGDVHRRATGPIHSSSPFYHGDVNAYAVDLARSNALLDQAGLTPNDDGIRLNLTVDGIPGSPELTAIQQYLVPSLAKVGIRLTMRNAPDFRSWARRISNYEFEMTIDSVWNWGDPAIGMHRSWLSSNIRKGVLWSNTHQYRNDRVDTLLADAGAATSHAQRKSAYREAQQIIVDDCPAAFLYELSFHYGINKRLASAPRSVWGINAPVDQLYLKG